MKIKLTQWTLEKCNNFRERINPKPQFQRTEVWSEEKKRLLVDSILRGYDIPKIYLNKLRNNPHFDYEVADGQQRLRALWTFIAGKYTLGAESTNIDNQDLQGLGFGDLSARMQKYLLNYKISISEILDAKPYELRMLFARLQMGVKLKPAELRNAIACAIGPVIDTLVETHRFFKECGISDKRFNHQDYLSHALLLCQYDNKYDLKAPELKTYYENQAKSYDRAFIKKVHGVLDEMAAINAADGGIVTKWGFVDAFWLIYRNAGKQVKCAEIAKALANFDSIRKANVRSPSALLNSETAAGRDMYEYILAFTTSASVKDRIAKRHEIYQKHFGKFFSSP